MPWRSGLHYKQKVIKKWSKEQASEDSGLKDLKEYLFHHGANYTRSTAIVKHFLSEQVTVQLLVHSVKVTANPFNCVTFCCILVSHGLQFTQGIPGINPMVGHEAQVTTVSEVIAVFMGAHLNELLDHLISLQRLWKGVDINCSAQGRSNVTKAVKAQGVRTVAVLGTLRLDKLGQIGQRAENA